jgi:hypothetical protein
MWVPLHARIASVLGFVCFAGDWAAFWGWFCTPVLGAACPVLDKLPEPAFLHA